MMTDAHMHMYELCTHCSNSPGTKSLIFHSQQTPYHAAEIALPSCLIFRVVMRLESKYIASKGPLHMVRLRHL